MSSIGNWTPYDRSKPLSVFFPETDRRTLASPVPEIDPPLDKQNLTPSQNYESKTPDTTEKKTDQVFKWSIKEISKSDKQHLTMHARMNLSLKLPLSHESTIDDLKRAVKGEPTPRQLFNWIENKGLNTEVTDKRMNLHDWRAQINKYYKIDQELIDVNHPTEKKGPHWPISLEHLRQHLQDATWQEHLNCNRGRALTHKITLKDLKNYLGEAPTPEQLFNWIANRDLDHEITAQDQPVSFKEFLTFIPNAQWIHHLNYTRIRPIADYEISPTVFEKYLGRTPTLQELMNWFTGDDLNTAYTEEEIDIFPWKQHVNEYFNRPDDHPIRLEELSQLVPKTITQRELINCNFGQKLSLGKGVPPKEHFKLVFERDPSGADLNDLTDYLNRLPTVKEVINWSLNRDLDSDYTQKEYTNRFPMEPILLISSN